MDSMIILSLDLISMIEILIISILVINIFLGYYMLVKEGPTIGTHLIYNDQNGFQSFN
jgi:hypothetical protein